MPALTVLIPAFRPAPLHWSVASVLTQAVKAPEVTDRHLVLLLNGVDELPFRKTLEETLLRLGGPHGWKIRFISKPFTPNLGLLWYDTLRELSDAGDLILLHGDDDLMLPDSLEFRVRRLLDSNADFLITQKLPDLVFGESEEGPAGVAYGWERFFQKQPEAGVQTMQWKDVAGFDTSFISTQIYRSSASFWSAVQRTPGLLTEGSPVPDTALMMFSAGLSLALISQKRAVQSSTFTLLRGRSTTEIKKPHSKDSVNRNAGLWAASLVVTLDRNFPFPELRVFRENHLQVMRYWFFSNLPLMGFIRLCSQIGWTQVLTLSSLPLLIRGGLSYLKSRLGFAGGLPDQTKGPRLTFPEFAARVS